MKSYCSVCNFILFRMLPSSRFSPIHLLPLLVQMQPELSPCSSRTSISDCLSVLCGIHYNCCRRYRHSDIRLVGVVGMKALACRFGGFPRSGHLKRISRSGCASNSSASQLLLGTCARAVEARVDEDLARPAGSLALVSQYGASVARLELETGHPVCGRKWATQFAQICCRERATLFAVDLAVHPCGLLNCVVRSYCLACSGPRVGRPV